jgi:cobalamin biosynthesis protein CobT
MTYCRLQKRKARKGKTNKKQKVSSSMIGGRGRRKKRKAGELMVSVLESPPVASRQETPPVALRQETHRRRLLDRTDDKYDNDDDDEEEDPQDSGDTDEGQEEFHDPDSEEHSDDPPQGDVSSEEGSDECQRTPDSAEMARLMKDIFQKKQEKMGVRSTKEQVHAEIRELARNEIFKGLKFTSKKSLAFGGAASRMVAKHLRYDLSKPSKDAEKFQLMWDSYLARMVSRTIAEKRNSVTLSIGKNVMTGKASLQ